MESEHRLATRLYQNTARVHFNDHQERRPARRLHRLWRGGDLDRPSPELQRARQRAARPRHQRGAARQSLLAGDTVFAWSEVLEKASLPGRSDLGALRLRLVATKNRPCADFPLLGEDGRHLPEVLLDLDYWALIPRRV